MRAKAIRFVLLIFAISFLSPVKPAQGAQIPVIDLGSFGGEVNLAYDINNQGQIVGRSRDVSENFDRAFLWQNGMMTDLGTLGGLSSEAIQINEHGQVVGDSNLAVVGKHAFLWEDGVMIDLGTLGGNDSTARDINNDGWVVGNSPNSPYSDGRNHAFLWRDGVMIDLGGFEEDYTSYAIDINEVGQIVGWASLEGGPFRSFIWENGVMTDLGVSGLVTQINDLGQAVGQSGSHAFLWQDGVITDLGALDADYSWATGINNHGQVVGYIQYSPAGAVHPFIWEDGVMTDLGLLSDVSAGAVDINEQGQVIGSAFDVAHREAGFFWDDGVMYSLGVNSFPTAINDQGNMVGYRIQRGVFHAVLWRTSR